MPTACISRAVLTAGFASAVIGGSTAGLASVAEEPPPFPREFRAAWVATVANIDWPGSSLVSGKVAPHSTRILPLRTSAIAGLAMVCNIFRSSILRGGCFLEIEYIR